MMGIDLVLPDFTYLRDHVDDDRGDRHHPRPRGPHRRAAVGAARAGGDERPGDLRRPADGRDGPLQARRAPAARGQARGPPDGPAGAGGPVRDRARPPHALDPRHVRRDPALRARDRAVHRRLQVRPDAGRRRARGRVAARRARPRRRAAAVRRLHQRRPPGDRRLGVDVGPQPRARVRPLQGPHRRHELRLEHPPRAAGHRRRRRRSTARSAWSGARCARTSTSGARSATSSCPRARWSRRASSSSGPTTAS